MTEPFTQRSIRIVEARSGNRIVTAIEIVSPANKIGTDGRAAYRRKRDELIDGRVSVVEIDRFAPGGPCSRCRCRSCRNGSAGRTARASGLASGRGGIVPRLAEAAPSGHTGSAPQIGSGSFARPPGLGRCRLRRGQLRPDRLPPKSGPAAQRRRCGLGRSAPAREGASRLTTANLAYCNCAPQRLPSQEDPFPADFASHAFDPPLAISRGLPLRRDGVQFRRATPCRPTHPPRASLLTGRFSRSPPPLPPVKNAAWARNGIDASSWPGWRRRGSRRRPRPTRDADPPAVARPDRPAADAGGGRRVPRDSRARAPTSGWSTGCWPRRTTASAGAGTGSTWPATPTATATRRTRGRPFAWRYRDWVIDALNRDLPFDQFTIEQLAGDLLPERDHRAEDRDRLPPQHADQQGGRRRPGAVPRRGRASTASTRRRKVWLGLTVGCCQCHDHKYDPFSQREYYQLFAFFNSDSEVDLAAPLPGEEASSRRQRGPRGEAGELQKAIDEDEGDRSRRRRPIEAGAADEGAGRPRQGRRQPSKARRWRWASCSDARHDPRRLPAQGRRGAAGHAGRPAAADTATDAPTRLDLARWIVDPDNPLTPRVTGRTGSGTSTSAGAWSPTPEDFGTQGEKPSHPELLDWLASELRGAGAGA